jgi:hypothetical protein
VNRFQLKEFNNEERIVYLYQPEGKGEWGEVIYTYADNSTIITKRAEENSIMHDKMALAKVKERVEKNNLPIKFTQAWY